MCGQPRFPAAGHRRAGPQAFPLARHLLGRGRLWLPAPTQAQPWLRGYGVGVVMMARQLIASAAFSPDELRIIVEPFDDAWLSSRRTSVPMRLWSKRPG